MYPNSSSVLYARVGMSYLNKYSSQTAIELSTRFTISCVNYTRLPDVSKRKGATFASGIAWNIAY
jgi:hypothetical protein